MSQMLKSSGAMGAATMLSRVLGMVREMVYASFMGDGLVAGAFQLAFTIPNLFRRLLGEGALTAAFIPVFKETEKREGEGPMWRAASAVLGALLIVSAGIAAVAVGAISITLLLGGLAPETQLMLRLLRLMFPYMIFVCAAAVFMGMLNARGHFFIPALGPAVLNVVMISSALLLAPRLGTELNDQVFGLAWGVLAAGLLQALMQLPLLHREGFRWAWIAPWREPTVRRVAMQMVPGLIGVAAFQINVALTQAIAFWFGRDGAPVLAPFNYAVRLMELPQGVFGISLATFLLPTLAGLAAEKKYPEFRSTLRQGVGYLSFVNLPASLMLVLLAQPMIRLLFERGEFGPDATDRAALALQFLAPGLVAFSFVNILARAFYALGDTATPMRISFVCLSINLLLAALFIVPLRQGGLGLANTLSAVLNVWLLGFALRKKLARLELATLRKDWLKMAVAAAFSGGIAWLSVTLWTRHFGNASLVLRIGEVFVPLTLAGLGYFAAAHALKLAQARDFLRALSRKREAKAD
jgi:putative peptidoglycan lipid II flippase